MQNLHTPGPWAVYWDRDEFDSRDSVLRILDPQSAHHPQGPLTIATVNAAAHAPHFDEPLANAALIAAAPLMLATLREAQLVLAEKLRRLGAPRPEISPTYQRITEALAKATKPIQEAADELA